MGEAKLFHARQGGERLLGEALEKGSDLVADLIAHLVGGRHLVNGLEQGGEQEFDEDRGLAGFVGCGERGVILRLALADHAFHREEGQLWLPAAQDERLPQPSDAAVSIGKGMNELELVMEHAARDQGMLSLPLQPAEQILHQSRYALRRWCQMHELGTLHDAHAGEAETPRMIHEAVHEQAMRREEVFGRGGGPGLQRLIGGEGIAHFLDVLGRTEHTLAVDHRCHLLQRQRVILDGEGGMNGAQPPTPPQLRRHRRRSLHAEASQRLADLHDKVEGLGRDREGRGVKRGHAFNSAGCCAASIGNFTSHS